VFLIDFNVLYWFSVLGSKFQAFLRISLVNVAVGGEMLLPSLCFFIVYVWDFFLNRYFFVLDRISGSCVSIYNTRIDSFRTSSRQAFLISRIASKDNRLRISLYFWLTRGRFNRKVISCIQIWYHLQLIRSLWY
jgi:hypothetical protein